MEVFRPKTHSPPAAAPEAVGCMRRKPIRLRAPPALVVDWCPRMFPRATRLLCLPVYLAPVAGIDDDDGEYRVLDTV